MPSPSMNVAGGGDVPWFPALGVVGSLHLAAMLGKGRRGKQVRSIALSAALTCVFVGQAWSWGQEGHSLIAEIAEHRLARESPTTMKKIQDLLGPGVSLASIASWADDYRDEDPGTYNWHFVDIPITEDAYDPVKHCARAPKG